jgi:hypothetical protein
MKIAIISDTHDNLKTLKKAINWINKENIQLILHCGDISSQETISEAVKFFKGEIKFVKGNTDYKLDDLPKKMEIVIDKKKIAFCHHPDVAKNMAESKKFDLVFYGHTHKPWEEKIGNCRLVNPGELAGQIFKPTFAIYNTETNFLELKILENLK